MKKKSLSAIAIVASAVIAGYNTFTSQKEVRLTDLALANVEALAGVEDDGGCTIGAYIWGDDWYLDTVHFYTCEPGCPEREGTSPKFREC